MLQITFRDRRTGETITRPFDQQWSEELAFWYSEGSGSSDSNRAADMYDDGSRSFSCSSNRPIIVIEKIESNGELVYQDPPEYRDCSGDGMKKARLDDGLREIWDIQQALERKDLPVLLGNAIERTKQSIEWLQTYPDAAEFLVLVERALAVAQRVSANDQAGRSREPRDLALLFDLGYEYEENVLSLIC